MWKKVGMMAGRRIAAAAPTTIPDECDGGVNRGAAIVKTPKGAEAPFAGCVTR
jgi:hypothetical protein